MADAGSINGLSKQFFERLKNQKPGQANGSQGKANPLLADGDVFSATQNAQAAQVNVYSNSGLVKNTTTQNTGSLKSDSREVSEDKEDIDDLTSAIKQNNQLAAAQGSGLNLDKVLSLLAD